MLLPKKFYNRPTLRVAQDLLGCFLVKASPQPLSKFGEGRGVRFKIVETEAYNGPNDLASHASIGKTKRNCVMFDEPGTIYVYLTYGMHYMLNIVTEKKDYPAAVLIRAVEPINVILSVAKNPVNDAINDGILRRSAEAAELLRMTTNGPARLTKALRIDKSFNNLPIYPIRKKSSNGASTKKYGLWIEDREEELKPSQIIKTTRIGVDYAKNYKDKKWRFYIKGNEFVSKK